jgi:hypothetical protein
LAKVPSRYVVHPDVPATNLKESIVLSKRDPGKLDHGGAGTGSAGHLAMEDFLKVAAPSWFTCPIPAPAHNFAAAVKPPGTTEKISADAALAVGGTLAEFAKFIATEQQRWKLVIARAKIKPD